MKNFRYVVQQEVEITFSEIDLLCALAASHHDVECRHAVCVGEFLHEWHSVVRFGKKKVWVFWQEATIVEIVLYGSGNHDLLEKWKDVRMSIQGERARLHRKEEQSEKILCI